MLVGLVLPLVANQIDLKSYASRFDSIPIAVLNFRALNNRTITKHQPWKVVADDLEFGGRFTVARGLKADSARFVQEQIGIFIDGEYEIKGNTVILNCYLHDAGSMDLLVGKKYQGELKYIRTMAHQYSNLIYDMVLGEKGPFTSKMVYVKDRGSSKDLVLMDYDGHNQIKLPKKSAVNIFPCFIDTNTIVWTSFVRGKPDLYKGTVYSSEMKIFIYSRYIETSPAVSTVVDRIVYSSSSRGNLDVYVCDQNGANRKQLTKSPGIDTSPCWSPNGYHIAFTSDRSGRPQIYIMDAEGANTKRLTFKGNYQDSPAWSPKGDKIAYSSLGKHKFDIYTINPDGSEPFKVTSIAGNNEYPVWSPEGSTIAFVSRRGGSSNIFTIRPDGTGLKQITKTGNAKMPDWSQF